MLSSYAQGPPRKPPPKIIVIKDGPLGGAPWWWWIGIAAAYVAGYLQGHLY